LRSNSEPAKLIHAHPPYTRRRAALIGVVTFISYAYFYSGGGWNQNSRFDLVRAIVERRTLRIDAYHENTQDKALVNGHYYSDKAPGLALLAVPIVVATKPVLRAAGIDPASPGGLVALSYSATVFAVALPMTAACLCLFLISLRLGGTVGAATFGAVSMGLATPMWAYSTLFWGHALAGACLLFAFALALMRRGDRSKPGDVFWGLSIGLAAGWATVTEYPAAPAAVFLAMLTLTLAWKDGSPRRWPVAIGLFLGAAPCIAVLLAYQHLAFGSALNPSYSYYPEAAFPWMKHGYMGLTYPRVDVMLKLLFGCRRGLLFVAPVALAAPWGLLRLYKQKSARAAATAAAAVAGYYFLFHASFRAWAGGWSYGPRYMAAGLPILCVGLAPAWSNASPVWRKVLAALAMAGVLLSLIAVAVTAQPPDQFRCPLLQLYEPSFWAGDFSQNSQSVLTLAEDPEQFGHGAFNLGELAGLHGLASLLPLLAVWAIAVFLWVRMNRADNRRSTVFVPQT
jgi:hypothetical protein